MVYTSYKQDFVNTRPRGRPPKIWTDKIRRDTGLHLLTAGSNAILVIEMVGEEEMLGEQRVS